MTCKDCIHYEVCERYRSTAFDFICDSADNCAVFKDKSLVVELPCKVGDTIYYLTNECDGCRDECDYCRKFCKKPKGITKIRNATIRLFRVTDNKICAADCDGGVWSSLEHCFSANDFGKTVFHTRKEAEKALKESKRE